HGVKRIRQTVQDREAKRQREQSKIKDYLSLTNVILSRKKNKDWSEDAFNLTTRILQLNPEFYTTWNYRRNIFAYINFTSSHQGILKILSEDLSMTMTALKAHPKVYWIWNHRRWCLENIPDVPESDTDDNAWKKEAWDRELFVVEKMLDSDPRNFHAWDYRRYILANMPIPRPPATELAYTSRKIESNFSNFSAWHQRSKVLSSLWESGDLDESNNIWCAEFELIRNAMYTDPNDQSVWMYHRWLVGSSKSCLLVIAHHLIASVRECHCRLSSDNINVFNIGCMESIVCYKRMLIKDHATDVDLAMLTRECNNMLQQLQELDPLRRRRYEDLVSTLLK
ncbi:uncharacterized protein LACBIDRAFT_233141, partial [Laccaria bicolor S238N-H82]